MEEMGRTKHDSTFKTKVVLDAMKESETLSDLAKKYEIAPKQITEWRKEFMEKSGIVFEYKETESKEIKALRSERDRLLKKVGQLTVEVDFCGSLRESRPEEEIRKLEQKRPSGMKQAQVL